MRGGIALEPKFIYTQKLSQTLQLSQSMKNSLDILKMSQQDLLDYIKTLTENNPVIEYTPSTDMHLLLQDSIAAGKTLKEDLYLQLHTTKQDADEDICNFLIESLDEHGFLNSSAAEYAEILGKAPICIQKNIQILQMFEPAGVAARDSIDSIRLQLLRNKKYTAEKIFTQYAEELIRKDYKAIAKDCGLSMEAVTQSLLEIQGCQPYPCSSYAGENNAILLPDFEIQTLGDEIEIIPKQLGHFQIQDELQAVKNDKELRAYFDEAYYFIDHLSKRNKTLLIMVNALIHIQRNHFLYMDELQPCTLLDIANKTGFHESTVSRTLSNKYYLFQNEIYAVKDLFVSATRDGSSKDSILKAIQKFVEQEDKENPYRDQDLAELLEEIDLYVSRRAIAKYRSILHIPGSKERKIR